MVLKQKQIKLDLSFGIICLMNYLIDRFDLTLYQAFRILISSFDESENFI